MKLAEERLWQEFVALYCQDSDSEQIIAFTRKWADQTEELLGPSSEPTRVEFRRCLDRGFQQSIVLSPSDGQALTVKANSDMVREALFLLTQVWTYAELLVSSLTVIELNMLETVFHLKISAMQEHAADETDEEKEKASGTTSD